MPASIRRLIDAMSDIGTAVRASREYSRLSMDAPIAQAEKGAIRAFMPN